MTITVDGKKYRETLKNLRRKASIIRAKGNLEQRERADRIDYAIDKLSSCTAR